MTEQEYQQSLENLYKLVSSWDDHPKLVLHRWLKMAFKALELEEVMLLDDVIQERLGWYKNAFEWALQKGMDLNGQDERGETFLHFVCSNKRGQTMLLNWLFEREVNPLLKDNKGKSAFEYLSSYNTDIRVLFKEYAENWVINEEKKALHGTLPRSSGSKPKTHL